jgi:hypothetical protein
MQDLEAKDFLVQQTAEQAALEHVPLSDLEKRMMYFTESGEMREDAIKLNDEFEAEYDSDEYEAKISKLLRHARARIKKENPARASQWKDAIRQLSKGDHYILVLCGEYNAELLKTPRPKYDSLKLLGTALLVIVVGGGAIWIIDAISDRYGIHWPKGGPETHSVMPIWLQWVLFGSIILGYINYVVLPWIFKRPPMRLSELLIWLLRAANKKENRPR